MNENIKNNINNNKNNDKYIILGLGVEGQASLEFLLTKTSPQNIVLADQNKEALKNEKLSMLSKDIPAKNLFLGDNYLDALDSGNIVVKSAGICINKTEKLKNYIENNKLRLSSNTDLFYENKKGKVIAVSGSKGKSTTTTLTYEIFKNAKFDARLIGNIGNPGTYELKTETSNTIYIFEMSSYQLENLNHKIDVGIFTSFFREHLDYHLTLENYKNAKLNLPKNIKDDGAFIYNPSLLETLLGFSKVLDDLKCKKLASIDEHNYIKDGYIFVYDKKFINTSELFIIGEHNYKNVLLAIRAAKLFNIEDEIIKETLRNFKPLPHRLEAVGAINGVHFIDDAISTTPESTIAAIESLSLPIYSIILGGLDRGYDFKELIEKVFKKDIKRIAFLKDSGVRIREELIKFYELKGKEVPENKIFDSMHGIIDFCAKDAPKDTICLLSCASPSYSIFKNYIEKGNLFREEIKQWEENKIR